MISEDVVDFEPGKVREELGQPGRGGFEGRVFVGEGAPTEVEGVTIEDQDVRLFNSVVQFFDEIISA